MTERGAFGAMNRAEHRDVKSRIADAAERARAEADERRKRVTAGQALPPEIDGRSGPEPIRYGDWESKGLASDF